MDLKYARAVRALCDTTPQDIEVDESVRGHPGAAPAVPTTPGPANVGTPPPRAASGPDALGGLQYLPEPGAPGLPFQQAINTLSDVSLLLVN